MTKDAEAAPVQTLLVVDSEVLVRMAIAAYLRDCGYRVIEAVSVEEALQVLEREEIVVSLVLAEVALAGSMDGFALAKWVRERKMAVDVILAAAPARAAEAAADLCDKGPMLARPYEPQIVLDRIRRMLAARKNREAKEPS